MFSEDDFLLWLYEHRDENVGAPYDAWGNPITNWIHERYGVRSHVDRDIIFYESGLSTAVGGYDFSTDCLPASKILVELWRAADRSGNGGQITGEQALNVLGYTPDPLTWHGI